MLNIQKGPSPKPLHHSLFVSNVLSVLDHLLSYRLAVSDTFGHLADIATSRLCRPDALENETQETW